MKLFPEVEVNYWVSDKIPRICSGWRGDELTDCCRTAVSGEDDTWLQDFRQDDGDFGSAGAAAFPVSRRAILWRGPELGRGFQGFCTIPLVYTWSIMEGRHVMARELDVHFPCNPRDISIHSIRFFVAEDQPFNSDHA